MGNFLLDIKNEVDKIKDLLSSSETTEANVVAAHQLAVSLSAKILEEQKAVNLISGAV